MSALAKELAGAIMRDPDAFIEERARRRLRWFTDRMVSGYDAAPHITDQLIPALERVTSTPNGRLIVTLPPRHSKSLHVSENLPAWYLGNHPDRRIIAASHTAQLAYTFSRRVRNKMLDPRYPFAVSVADDKGAVQAWDTSEGGGYLAVGVGGSPTGSGADVLIIDDYLRSAADADSQTIRDAQWEWYQGTMRTRLEPGGSIIITACMVGDTEVTMADGSLKHLRDIVVGDRIATYENGRLATSRILNWINHGPDLTYEIRTISGRIIKANERHPFLVDTGDELVWKRVRHLRAGDRLVGASTGVLPASGTDVTSRRSARATATATTTSGDGPVASAPHPSTMSHVATLNSNGDTVLPPLNTTRWWKRKAAFAQYAASRLKRWTLTSLPTARTGGSLSTTATTPARSEAFSVTSATSPSGTVTLSSFSSALPSTSDFIPDEITAITPSGVEDVFDIQVERTENFIANGVVSHNTRWHDDDLTGRLMAQAANGGEQWRHLYLPAVLDDGTALWPERWPLNALDAIRRSVGSRAWEAQYMGRPVAQEGGILKRPWFGTYTNRPVDAVVVQFWDTAYKTGTDNDYTVCATLAYTRTHRYVLDVYRERLEYPDLKRMIPRLFAQWRPEAVLIEDKASGQSALQDMRRETDLPVIGVPVTKDKIARVNEMSPAIEAGRLLLPEAATWLDDALHELTTFPLAAHDDIVDAIIGGLAWIEERTTKQTSWSGSWLPDDDDDDHRSAWR